MERLRKGRGRARLPAMLFSISLTALWVAMPLPISVDKLKQYPAIIRRLLEEYRQLYEDAPGAEVEMAVICDDQHGEYLLMRVGWRQETRIRRALLYLRLRNGKIWIEEDWTEDGTVTALMDAGIPNEDIVLAFNPPEVRHLTEFAVA